MKCADKERAMERKLKLVLLGVALTAWSGFAGGFAQAQPADPFEQINKRFQERKGAGEDALQSLQDQFQAKRAAMEEQWRKREQEIEQRWQERKREIEKKWAQAQRSTQKEWVDYSPGNDSRSIVNFEEGTVEIATLLPVTKLGRSPKEQAVAAQEEISRQLEQILSEKADAKRAILAGQMATSKGKPVDPKTAKAFVQQEVVPNLVVDDKPAESRDGVSRIKVTAKLKMTPDHLKKRAQQYLETVLAESRRRQLDPRLVLAVIQTESYFNPKAESHIPAYGLMQLVPRSGARDAYNFVYNDDKVLDDDYLFQPAQNVELGAAYLHLLMSKSFSDVQTGDKKNYLVICAYNWGPGNVRKRIMGPYRIHELSDSQVFALLTEKAPEETRNYLKRVTERMSLYEDLVGR
jgi:membrane-bound lytic murein transglycosylase C